MDHITFVGLDVHKAAIAVSLAQGGEVRYLGQIGNRPEAVRGLAERLSRNHRRLGFCYEAGPCGYGVHRRLTELGHECTVEEL